MRIGLLALATLAGCAITSGHESGPNGRPVHFIDGMSARTAYQKANELCPSGYAILGMPMQVSLIDYVMTVECKAGETPRRPPAATAQPVVDTGAPTPARQPGPVAAAAAGKDLFQAERQAREAGCGSRTTATLSASGPGFETYTATCTGGDVMVLRCEMGNCRALK